MNIKIFYIINLIIYLIFSFSTQAKDASKIWINAHKSVVTILPTWPGYAKPGFGAPSGTAPAGTGFYISIKHKKETSNFILTAAHVIQKSTSVEIKNYKNNIEIVEIIFKDIKRDIAILRSKTKGLVLNISMEPSIIGNKVCVIGNSFGLGPSLSCGVISAKNRKNIGFNQIENFIQTDAAVNPGDSGAPLLDDNGKLVGMVDAIFTKEADIDAGVNFVIDNELIYESINENINLLK
jgi:S1-C subfamily serine protease